MKILTKKKQKEIIEKIIENERIYRREVAALPPDEKVLKSFERQIENNIDVIYAVGGLEGLIDAAYKLKES